MPVIIKPRPIDATILQEGLSLGLPPIIAQIFATRKITDVAKTLKPNLSHIAPPHTMQDLLLAAKRVVLAIQNQEVIGLETDHVCDGQTSHAVLFYNLTRLFGHAPTKIRSYIGHRLQEGYGLSWPLCERILADEVRPSLIITADNGSTDEERIAHLKKHNITVIVTDHHTIPKDGYPKSAFACLNPTRKDCSYDPYIAGCMVAWLLMAQVRILLIAQGLVAQDAPKLYDTLDYVAVGTVADCVSLAKSHTNRAIVNFGRRLIKEQIKPCWQVLAPFLTAEVPSQDLAFIIAPLLNSDGRLDTALNAVKFLLATDGSCALVLLEGLKGSNQERKQLQKTIINNAWEHCALQQHKNSLCIYLPDGHSGVHGIAASKIKDRFGKPTIFLAPKLGGELMVTGSVRGVDGFHVYRALEFINKTQPNLFVSFGGHEGAGGVTLAVTAIDEFSALFELAVNDQVNGGGVILEPVIWTDGELLADNINLETINLLTRLEPFGRGFELPIFNAVALIKNIKVIGDGTHVNLFLLIGNKNFNAIWFNCRNTALEPLPIKNGQIIELAFQLRERFWNNNRECQVQVVGLQNK